MSEELFNLPPSPSPRIKWMREHAIQTHYCADIEDGPWSAWTGSLADAIETEDGMGYGMTEEDAVIDYAKNANLKLWNE